MSTWMSTQKNQINQKSPNNTAQHPKTETPTKQTDHLNIQTLHNS